MIQSCKYTCVFFSILLKNINIFWGRNTFFFCSSAYFVLTCTGEYKNNYRSWFIFSITFCLKITVQLGQNTFSQFGQNSFSITTTRSFRFLQKKIFYIKTLHINSFQWKSFNQPQSKLFVLHLYMQIEAA